LTPVAPRPIIPPGLQRISTALRQYVTDENYWNGLISP
jgi:hypothetical protein